MKRNLPLHIHISSLFLLLILLVGGLLGGLGFKLSRDMLESTTVDLTQRISRETMGEVQRIFMPAEMAVNLLGFSAITEATTFRERWLQLGLLRETLENSAALSSVYVGYDNGDFFFIRSVKDYSDRQVFKAPEGTRYIVQSIERTGVRPRGRYIFLDAALSTLRDDDKPEYAASYDPRTRSWYKDAKEASGQIKTPPYLFFSNRKVGSTLANRAKNGHAVVGADILLATLGSNLARQKVTPHSQVVLVNPLGYVLAHEDVAKLVTVPPGVDAKPSLTRIEDIGSPVLGQLAGLIQGIQGIDARSLRLKVRDDDWRVSIHPLLLDGAPPMFLVIAIPDSELLAAALKLRSTTLIATILIILLAVPVAWFIARGISGPLRALVADAEAIRRFDFSKPITVRSLVEEVNALGVTMDGMKRTISRFLEISQATAAEKNFERLLPMLLTETLAAADADAGILYLADADGLIPAAAMAKNGDDLMDHLLPVAMREAGPLMDEAIKGGRPSIATACQADLDAITFEGELPGVEAREGVAVPLLNRQEELVGIILLLRATLIDDAQVSFVKALSGSATSTLETRELIKAQKELFESFIKLIAGAIDAKSPYTGGHCERVPELTKMLARAACADTTGPFKDFQLGEDEWEAVHIAAWLHDCGKVTTPEYVVDKATKLETIYDRIHEVRMRFEVLKRDAEIACLKAIASGADEIYARACLTEELKQIDDDYAFIATCNEGGEFMAPAMTDRLTTIATRTWLRTLNDRIGISQEEKLRKAVTPELPLPVTESLLADKPEHIFERRPQDRMPENNRWGFKMKVPEKLYNKGELYNLAVGRGTLAEEDRYKINEHIVQTIIMLSTLPFPKHLRQVSEIAGGHHEKMNGTGYPRCLTRDDMSPVARMMSIADIFEALTAVDRPYKKGKTLSEAIKIMSFMKKDQHLDPELFDLFLRSGVYREYAERFMKPEQLDEVNVDTYLTLSPA
jgi:HD-GYP domain-containing protein (c-di-GMP phosphodiesterase class II)